MLLKINLLFHLLPGENSLENVWHHIPTEPVKSVFSPPVEPQGNNSRLPSGGQQRPRPAGSPATSFPPSRVSILFRRRRDGGSQPSRFWGVSSLQSTSDEPPKLTITSSIWAAVSNFRLYLPRPVFISLFS